MRSRAISACVAVSVLCLGLFVYERPALYFNTSGSMPFGYFVSVQHAPIATGDTVLACPPEDAARVGRERGYLRSGSCPGGSDPVVKIAALQASLTPDGLCVEHRVVAHTVPVARDADRRSMQIAQPRVVTDSVWLISPVDAGFDSRYFGPVSSSSVRRAFYLAPPPHLPLSMEHCS